jgi:signal transduction histidine kinase
MPQHAELMEVSTPVGPDSLGDVAIRRASDAADGDRLASLLDTIILAANADGGACCVVDDRDGTLRLIAHRGLAPASLTALAIGLRADLGTGGVRPLSREGVTDDGFAARYAVDMLSSAERLTGGIVLAFTALNGLDETRVCLVERLARHAADAVDASRSRRTTEALCAEARIACETAKREVRTKNEFLAILSHELRQPLSAALPAIEIQKRSLSPERRHRAGEVLAHQLNHLARLVNELSDISRIGLDGIVLVRERVDLCFVLRQAIEMSTASFAKRRQTVSVSVTADRVVADADGTRVTQVFSNLLQNAAAYTPDGGHIAISLSVVDGQAVCRVRDNGIGIEAESIGRIFEPFERGSHGGGPGFGIGLSLVRLLTELHGGHVSVTSEGPGRGSEFTVTFPLHRRVADSSH